MAKGKQSDPIVQQLMMQRLMYGNQQPAIQVDNPTTLGGGIAEGLANAANNIIQARRNQQLMGAMAAAQQQHQQALADKAAAETNAKELFYLSHGWSPEQAKIDAAAGLSDSTINNILSAQQAVQADQTQQARKDAIWQSTYDATMARLGNDPNAVATAQLAANAAAYGATPLGAAAFNQDIAGTLNSGRLSQLTGGNPNSLNQSAASPALQNAAAAYGIPTLNDAYSHLNRKADLSAKLTNNQYIAPLNDASLASSAAGTQGKMIDNQLSGINLGLAKGQLGLNDKFNHAEITAPELLKGSLGYSLNPIQQLNNITGNKALYGHGNSLIPKAEGLNFVPPAPPQSAAPVAPQPAAPLPLFINVSPTNSGYDNGQIIQHNAMNELNKFGQGIQTGVGNVINGATDFGQTVSGFLGLPRWQAPWQQPQR